eukprot:TRINITY_DN7512_c0_g2_i1.p1 TRINITY_DN7512_c0_g2~~TRINITY_DN7512_c0_g2_i1.p1  ORF type:complete len:121 (-),score=11.94 TRINITY_DN7512_c0_g2_i1:109-471(-)
MDSQIFPFFFPCKSFLLLLSSFLQLFFYLETRSLQERKQKGNTQDAGLVDLSANCRKAGLTSCRHAGIDAYILGLGSSVGVMVWAGERWIIKKETNPAAILALSAASIGVMFTIAIYHNV